jgi:hypothetical protein
MRSGRAPLRWWLLLVMLLAMAALATVGRQKPVRVLDVTPVVAEPPAPPSLTSVRAI